MVAIQGPGGPAGPAGFPMRIPQEYRGQLQMGQPVTGHILGFYDGKAVGVFNGIPLLAETSIPLKAGETINAQVTKVTDDQVFIKLLERTGDAKPVYVTDKNVTDVLDSLKLPVNDTSQSIVRSLLKFNQPLDFKTIAEVVSRVKGGALPVAQEAEVVSFLKAFDLPMSGQMKDVISKFLFRPGTMSDQLGQLQSLMASVRDAGGAPSGAMGAFLQQFQAAMNSTMADPSLGASDLSWRLPALLEAIGFDRERKMAELLVEKGADGVNLAAKKTTLLGTLLGMSRELQALAARLGGEKAGSIMKAAEMSEGIARGIISDKVASSSMTDYMNFQIPIMLPDGMGNAQIRVGARKEREKGKRIDPNDVQIAFLLDMTKLGAVRVDVKILDGSVSLKFLTENRRISNLIEREVGLLSIALEKIGYSMGTVVASVARREQIEEFEWGKKVEPEHMSGIDVII